MKFIPFVKKNVASDYRAATYLARELSERYRLSPEAPQTELKPLVISLSQALKKEDTVVIGVSRGHYLKLKKALSVIFRRDLFEAQAVKRDVLLTDSEAHELYYQFLEGSAVFKSVDGLYSGYGIAEGEQKVIVLPLNENRHDVMLDPLRAFVFDEEALTDFTLEQEAKYKVKLYGWLSAVFITVAVVLAGVVGYYFTHLA